MASPRSFSAPWSKWGQSCRTPVLGGAEPTTIGETRPPAGRFRLYMERRTRMTCLEQGVTLHWNHLAIPEPSTCAGALPRSASSLARDQNAKAGCYGRDFKAVSGQPRAGPLELQHGAEDPKRRRSAPRRQWPVRSQGGQHRRLGARGRVPADRRDVQQSRSARTGRVADPYSSQACSAAARAART